MYIEKQAVIEEHVIDAINGIRAKSNLPDSTSILEYINKNLATNADEIYVDKTYKFY